MKYFNRVLLVLVLAGMQSGAIAQVPNNINVRASGALGVIGITVDLDIGGTLPSSWVGWVLDRKSLGVCEDVVQVGIVRSFPAGVQSYHLFDGAAEPTVTYQYRVYAVDAEGSRIYLPAFTEFPPSYYHFDYASINETGYVATGTIPEGGWAPGFEICQDECWWYISFISEAPAELAALAGTGTVVRISGQLGAEFEGTYVSNVTSWEILPGCAAVPNVAQNWGTVKASYR